MKGRGAKITCPKCAHVFVVFADGASGSASDDPDGSSSLRVEDTLKERLARRDASTTHSALQAIGFGEDVERSQTSSKIRVVAPGPRGSRKPVAMLDTNHSLSNLDQADGEGGGGYLGPEITSADELDFREVGITTWKVKVAIGLVYDFSDVATLKRYLADKRVTTSDLLSHDGKGWTVIGDIPDLDSHFIDTWKAAFVRRKNSSAPQSEPESSADEPGSSYATSTGRMGALSPSGHHRTVRSRPKKKRAPKKPVEKSGSGGLALLAGILVIGGVGYFLTRPPDLGGAVTPSSPPLSSETAADLSQNQAEQDRIRKGVKDEVARQREKMMVEERAAAAAKELQTEEAERDGVVDLSKMEAVRPDDQRTKVKSGSLAAPVRSPVRLRGELRKPPSQAFGGGGGTTSVERDTGGSMWLAQGNKALAAGNYGSATTMFQQCVNKNAAAGECWAGLGKSLQRTGKSEEATAAFDRATALGVRVNRSGP